MIKAFWWTIMEAEKLTFGLLTTLVNPSLQPNVTRLNVHETNLILQNNPLHVLPDPLHCTLVNLEDFKITFLNYFSVCNKLYQ